MKKIIISIVFVLGGLQIGLSQQKSNLKHPKGVAVAPILKEIVENGCPGASIAIFDADGWWIRSEGFSSLEKQLPMKDSHLQYLQSIAKTYMAVAVLKLYEEGKLSLDDSITKYLEPSVFKMVDRADEITVRMLLNHTSGVPEYNFNPEYASTLLQHPETPFTALDYIKFIKGKKLSFEPGTRYSYRNTNYVLLSMIVDNIAGDHGKFIEQVIFEPMGLKHTYYQITDEKLNEEKLSDSYWDRYSDGLLENISYIQKQNVTYMVGDDGVVTTPEEAVLFLKGLLEGKLLKDSTLQLMKTWVNNGAGKPAYGLGLGIGDILGHPYYGHSGGGIGAGCELRYFPENELYMFIAINIGTVTESPLHGKIGGLRDKLFATLAQ